MKSFSMFLPVLLSSSFAFACPDLAGNYLCPQEGSDKKIETQIVKTQFDGVLTFIMKDADRTVEFVTNGFDNDDFERLGSHLLVTTLKSSCDGSRALVSQVRETVIDEEKNDAVLIGTLDMRLSINGEGSLVISGVSQEASGGSSTQIICKKK